MPSDKPKHPGGRPRKDNIKWYCYLDKLIAQRIDEERGALTRGEFVTMLIGSHAIDKSNRPAADAGTEER